MRALVRLDDYLKSKKISLGFSKFGQFELYKTSSMFFAMVELM